ncbi:hypothetical protein PNEG_02273 [Pneumocystis murina B123]|uniref:Homeobox domain-containing protein n=1 Tax=Pneumocystis murina (strain B123) TaxID=1069680 RepID=M7P643_PNEMU|nr:hypothetical protein PNEG_02273 [Pneumocystis murina B123]EMR09315.1 hypothetical protein PNEG_02273 [Pneumocystis murina B123]
MSREPYEVFFEEIMDDETFYKSETKIERLMFRRQMLLKLINQVIDIRDDLLYSCHGQNNKELSETINRLKEVLKLVGDLKTEKKFDSSESILVSGIYHLSIQIAYLSDLCRNVFSEISLASQRYQYDLVSNISKTNKLPLSTISNSSRPKHSTHHPENRTRLLKDWFLEHISYPYPNKDEKRLLCRLTGLKINQLNMWFINARRRSNGGLKFKEQVVSDNLVPLVFANSE